MDEKFSQIAKKDKEFAEHLVTILDRQVNTSFGARVDTDKWLTQHNFLINAGGAAAILGYLSSEPTPDFAIAPLVIFLSGVIASGIEIRYLLKVHQELNEDALQRRDGFVSDKLTVAQVVSVDAPKTITKNINHYSGLVAQWSFAIGSIVGVIGFLCN